MTWKPISEFPIGDKLYCMTNTVLCANKEHGWIRMGRYYTGLNKWYYSGTSERSQYNQTEGDNPTHFQELDWTFKGG